MIFVQDDVVTVHKDLQSVLLRNVKSAAQLNRKNNTAKLIYFSDYSGGFHFGPSVHEIIYPTKYINNYTKNAQPVNRNF